MDALELRTLNADQAVAALPELVELLVDSVDHGASVGYLSPMDAGIPEKYWLGVAKAVEEGDRILWVALLNGQMVGTAQLSLERRPNGDHRGEVSKVLVHSTARRHGIGRSLMLAIEDRARAEGRTLLVLDTVAGDAGEKLYLKVGYSSAGLIPDFAKSSRGGLEPTNIMFKLLA